MDAFKYVELLNHAKNKPAFSEDRFRIRGRGKDLTTDQTRTTMWNATMAGGVAGIWGYLGTETGKSRSYPNKEQLLTYSKFFKDRAHKTSQPLNSISNINLNAQRFMKYLHHGI